MSYIGLNLTCSYVRYSGFGFQRDGSFNAEIISTSFSHSVFRSRVLAFGLWLDQRYDVQVRFVLSGNFIFEYPMWSFMEWMSKQKKLRNLRWSGRNVARSRSSGRRSRISCASNIGFFGTGARGGVISSPWNQIFRSNPSPQLMDKVWASGRNASTVWWYLSPRHFFVRHELESFDASWFVRHDFT